MGDKNELRDEFASRAMAAIISKIKLYDNHSDTGMGEFADDGRASMVFDAVARGAYSYADAMMRARK